MNPIIETLRIVDAGCRTALQKQPSLLKNGSYEIVLLQVALRMALGDEAEAVLDEVLNLTSKAWIDANL